MYLALRLLVEVVVAKSRIEPSQDAVDLVSWHPNLMQEEHVILAYKDGAEPATAVALLSLKTGMMIFHRKHTERRTIPEKNS